MRARAPCGVCACAQACMQWEPYVVPNVTAQVNAQHAQRAPADFSTTVQDCWLQLLQAASATARALQAVNRAPPTPPLPQLGASASMALPTTPSQALGPGLTSMPSDASALTASQVRTSCVLSRPLPFGCRLAAAPSHCARQWLACCPEGARDAAFAWRRRRRRVCPVGGVGGRHDAVPAEPGRVDRGQGAHRRDEAGGCLACGACAQGGTRVAQQSVVGRALRCISVCAAGGADCGAAGEHLAVRLFQQALRTTWCVVVGVARRCSGTGAR